MAIACATATGSLAAAAPQPGRAQVGPAQVGPAQVGRAQAGQHRRDPRGPARVVQAADHQFALQPGRELRLGRTEFGERPFDDIHRVHPPEQGRIGLGHLQRDLGADPRAGRHAQRLLQQHEGPLPPGGHLGAGRFPQDPGPLPGRRRFGQRPVQQIRRGLRRAAVHGRPRRLAQPRQDPAITGRPHPDQMRGHLARRGHVSVQQPGRAAMGAVPFPGVQHRFERIADHRMHEPRPPGAIPRHPGRRRHLSPEHPGRGRLGRQHLGPGQAPGQPLRGGQRHPRDRRRVPQLAAVPQHGQRLSQAQRVRTQAPHPGDHLPRDPVQSSGQQLGRLQRGQRPRPRSAARSSSVRYSGLPPQAAYTAAHSSSPASPPTSG